jgi:proton-coupled amino acid transporter
MDIPKSKRDSGLDRGQYTPRSRSASPVQITLDLPPNARERAFREGNFSPAVSHNSRNSFYRNSPQISAPIGDILNDEGNVGSLPNTIPEDEAAKVVKLHLVTNEDACSYMSDAASEDDYTTSHHLQGGSITRDIYKWQEDYENQVRIRRSQSFHALSDAENGEGVSNLLTPGGFRRNFLVQKAIQEGREPPNLLTNNFIDFLALYGHFAGDYYPSDDEYDEEGDEEEGDRGLGTSNVDETTPLNRTTERVKPPAPAQGTASPKKVFFLLMKSFVGTGVLFLPKSFYNGGMLFSTICLMVVAYLSLYCMLLLIESHNIVGGSFGDIGKKLYGRYARYSVLFSIVLSQVNYLFKFVSTFSN